MKTDELMGTYEVEDNTENALIMLGKGYDQENIIRELPSKMSGFTPAPDLLITEYGFVTALVWGKVWRYCQMSDGICRAKLDTLAGQLGMSIRTIIRHIEPLVDGGYLKDTTPDLKNKPHIYADTGKIRIKISVEATMTKSQSTMSQSHSRHDRESLEESISKKEIKENTGGEIFKAFQDNIAMLTPMQADKLKDAEKEYPQDWIIEAIALAVMNNKRNWAYCEAILKRWKNSGKDSGKKIVPVSVVRTL